MDQGATLYLDLLDELYKTRDDTSQQAMESRISKIILTCDIRPSTNTNNININYSSQIIQILDKIKNLLKFDDQFESQHLDIFITINKGINLVLNYGLYPFAGCYFRITEKPPTIDKSLYPVQIVTFLLNYQNFNSLVRLNTDLKVIKLLLYGGFGLLFHLKHVHRDERLEVTTDEKIKSRLSELSLYDAIQILMEINTTVLTKEMSKIVTDKLKFLLQKSSGFYTFIDVIVKSKEDDQPIWKRGEIASRIVSAKGHSAGFYGSIIEQIFDYINDTSLEMHKEYISIYAMTLSRIYFILKDDIQTNIRLKLFGNLDVLASPRELLTGFIVLENSEFRRTIHLIHTMFCGTSTCSMKTVLLIPYISILFKIFALLPNEIVEKKIINSIIVQCLINRSQTQLHSIVECMLLNHDLHGVHKLHNRIGLNFQNAESVNFIITPGDQFYNPIDSFITILRNSSNNLLIYSIFLIVLKLFETIYDDNAAKSLDLLDFDEDAIDPDFLSKYIMKNFNKKMLIVNLLNEIILIKEFHSQISENSNEILNFVKTFLERQLSTKEINENLLTIIFSIIKIFGAELDRNHELMRQINKLLEKLKKRNMSNDFIVKQINLLADDMIGNGVQSGGNNDEYQTALALCNESEAFLQVYGIHTLIKLARNQDEHILANKYEVLLLGFRILKNDRDSYTYLNCINLMIELARLLRMDFFDSLVIEFDSEDGELDYRLKIGEIIVKVTEALGKGAYKYKDLLINCFMKGSRSKSNEFRTSSLSNLGTICHLFSYQVHHFFQELMILTESIISCDTYLPSRRASIMVLSHLLFGIDNIVDFQEYLIPIYRSLKNIVNTESDKQILMHAQIGLEHLTEKTKKFLLPEPKLEREIKIFGIKDDAEEITTKKIIELN